MFDRDRWQEIFSSLKKNRLRTGLTAFGVIWGILLLIILVGIGKGLRNGLYYGFEEFALNSLFVWTQETTEPYNGFPRGRYWSFTNDDTQALIDNVKEIEIISPRASRWSEVIRDVNTGNYRINGDYPTYNDIDPKTLAEGRFINFNDIHNKSKVAVIGKIVREEMFLPHEDPVGKYIKIQGVYFQIVGVYHSKRPVNRGGNWDNQQIMIPFSTMQKAYNMGNQVDYYGMVAKTGVPVSKVEEKVRAILGERHNISPTDQMAFGSENVEEQVRQFTNVLNGIRILIWFVGTMTLIAGVIGISNIMLVIVRERTKEIGIQRALGATPRKIVGAIIQETVFLTFAAGFTGLFFATLVVEIVGITMFSDTSEPSIMHRPEIDLVVGLVAIMVLVGSGALAGLIPARRAIKIKPIDALRSEI
jgi:putative ABC transport system permease protein